MEELLVEIARRLESEYADKYVDENFLRWIFDSVVDIQGTREYVCNGFQMGGRGPSLLAMGGYNKNDKKIVFFNIAFAMAKSDVYNKMKIGDEDNHRFLAANMLMINMLLHELEHVNQHKKMDNEDSFETYLLNCQNGRTENYETYSYSPNERFANCVSIKRSLTILNNMGIIAPEINDYLEIKHNLYIIKGYVDEDNQCMVCPVKRYMNKHNINFAEMSLEEALEMYPNLEDRLYYGLPISDEEYFLIRKKAGLTDKYGSYSLV